MQFLNRLILGAFTFVTCTVLALVGLLFFAFPREMKEFKKDIIDMFDDGILRWFGYLAFMFSVLKIYGLFDGLDEE